MTFEQYEEKCDKYFDNMDDYGESLEIPNSMFDCDDEFTTITTTEDEEVCTTSADELCPTTTIGEDEEEVRNMSDNAIIDDEFTTSTTSGNNNEEWCTNEHGNLTNNSNRHGTHTIKQSIGIRYHE